MKGIIISIEGTDGSGKHTQQQLLKDELKNLGYKTFEQSFPNYESGSSMPVRMYLAGEFGDNANSMNAYQASTLYACDRLCTYKKDLQSHYENGEILLFDRYVQSNFIHQCSKIEDEKEQEKFLRWNEELEFSILGLPKPDLVFFIEMPTEKSIELAHARGELKAHTKKDIHEQDSAYLKKSYETGIKLAKKFNWKIVHCIDDFGNLKSIEQIHLEIMKESLNFLNSIKANSNSKN